MSAEGKPPVEQDDQSEEDYIGGGIEEHYFSVETLRVSKPGRFIFLCPSDSEETVMQTWPNRAEKILSMCKDRGTRKAEVDGAMSRKRLGLNGCNRYTASDWAYDSEASVT